MTTWCPLVPSLQSPLLVTICYSNPFYQKTQGTDTAQVLPSGSKQAAAVRMSDWEGNQAESFKRRQKWCSGTYTPLPGTLRAVVTVQANLFQDSNCSKNWKDSGMLLSSSPSFPSRQQSEIGYFDSGQMLYLWLSLFFIYEKHVACYFKRTENGNLLNKLLFSLAFPAQQLFSPEVNLLQSSICKVIICPLVNIPLCFNLVVIRQTIHFMDKDFKVDIRIHFIGSGHSKMQPS